MHYIIVKSELLELKMINVIVKCLHSFTSIYIMYKNIFIQLIMIVITSDIIIVILIIIYNNIRILYQLGIILLQILLHILQAKILN